MQASPYEPERRGQNASGGGRDSARNSIPAANVNRIQAALDGGLGKATAHDAPLQMIDTSGRARSPARVSSYFYVAKHPWLPR